MFSNGSVRHWVEPGRDSLVIIASINVSKQDVSSSRIVSIQRALKTLSLAFRVTGYLIENVTHSPIELDDLKLRSYPGRLIVLLSSRCHRTDNGNRIKLVSFIKFKNWTVPFKCFKFHILYLSTRGNKRYIREVNGKLSLCCVAARWKRVQRVG